jgi:orotidine-5'-phosphate decarboxylase
MREEFGPDPILVVPGIRPSGFEKGDQKRVMTPGEAAKAGSTHLVIGRPIVKAADPVAVYDQITDEIRSSHS